MIYLDTDLPDAEFVKKVVNHSQMSISGYPSEFLDRIAIFNAIFPKTAYELLGIATKWMDVRFVVKQPFVAATEIGKIRDKAQRNEAFIGFTRYMESLGFSYIGDCTYHNRDFIVSDLHEGNILMNDEGNFFVIDANVRLNDDARLNGQARYEAFRIDG